MGPVQTHRLIAFDETPLFFRRAVPRDTVKAVLFVIHGMGEHGGCYTALGECLAARGIESWIPDLRGFGKSGGKRGHVLNLAEFEKDFAALFSLAEKTHRGAPFFLMGHSFGGLLAATFLMRCRLTGLKGFILSSPLFGISIPVPAWKTALARVASRICPSMTQNSPIPPEFLTHDPAMRRARAEDPLIHFRISARLYTQMTLAIPAALNTASLIKLPALILQAGDDRIVSREKTVEFYRRLSSPDKEIEVYEGWYHEILNEAERQRVFERVLAWISKRI